MWYDTTQPDALEDTSTVLFVDPVSSDINPDLLYEQSIQNFRQLKAWYWRNDSQTTN